MGYSWQYYDLVLVGIFAAMAAGVALGAATELPTVVSTIGAGAVAIALMGHGLFVNGPVEEPADLADEVDALN